MMGYLGTPNMAPHWRTALMLILAGLTASSMCIYCSAWSITPVERTRFGVVSASRRQLLQTTVQEPSGPLAPGATNAPAASPPTSALAAPQTNPGVAQPGLQPLSNNIAPPQAFGQGPTMSSPPSAAAGSAPVPVVTTGKTAANQAPVGISGLSNPVAYFPLQGGSLNSVTPGQPYGGTLLGGATFAIDSEWNVPVLECFKPNMSAVSLGAVSYGTGGPWAITMWVKPGGLVGTGYEYLFSQNQSDFTMPNIVQPNQVQILLPEALNSAYGVIRALVRDGSDPAARNSGTYLDSDNTISQTSALNMTTGQIITDGHWHMIGVTTHPEGGKGFQIYLDGQEVANMSPGNYTGSDGTSLSAVGGAPMQLAGNITLCARSDLDPNRFYSGYIANLGIYNTSLTPAVLGALYTNERTKQLSAAKPSTVPSGGQLPPQIAFFPLTGGIINSTVSGTFYNGTTTASFEMDADLGVPVLQCSKSQQEPVLLDSVPYGRQGPWAMNIWAKLGDQWGQDLQYLYSHWNSSGAATAANSIGKWFPNQVNLYIPEQGHSSFGVVRALVKDSADNETDAAAASWLDSDNQVGISASHNSSLHLSSRWHMLTLTTHLEGGKGLQMYIDGVLVSETLSTGTYIGDAGLPVKVTGGAPLLLDGPITLCSRSDLISTRYFNGRLAELSLYNAAIGPGGISQLFARGISGISNVGQIANDNALGTVSGTPICVVNSKPSYYASNGVNASTVGCIEGNVCQPLAVNDTQTFSLQALSVDATLGVCVAPLVVGQPNITLAPNPTAFYPLGGGLRKGLPPSWPLPQYLGEGVNYVSLSPDPVFGKVTYCNKSTQDALVLPELNYAAAGGFAINLWAKVGNTSERGPQYLFSHGTTATPASPFDPWAPNQVEIYLPAISSSQLGIVRAYVKDDTDTNYQAMYVDSDGLVAQPLATLPQTGGNTKATTNRTVPVNVMDGMWHMITLTSQPDRELGYRLYVDGVLAGQLSVNSTMPDGTSVFHVDGGGTANVTGPMTLCSRTDGDADRFFDGSIAQLGLYDSALTGTQVAAIYHSVATTAAATAANGSQTCTLPLTYGGATVNGCASFNSGLYCWSIKGSWIPCGPGAPGSAGLVMDTVTQLKKVQRVSLDNNVCTLPTVYGDAILDDCIKLEENGQVTAPVCITAAGWRTCAPLGTRLAGQTSSTDIATIVIAVVCSLIGVLLLGALAIFCYMHRDRRVDKFERFTGVTPSVPPILSKQPSGVPFLAAGEHGKGTQPQRLHSSLDSAYMGQGGIYSNATSPPMTAVAAATAPTAVRNSNSADPPPPGMQRASSRNLNRGDFAALAPARISIARQDSGYTDRPPPLQQASRSRNIIRDDLTAPYGTAQLQAPRNNPAVEKMDAPLMLDRPA